LVFLYFLPAGRCQDVTQQPEIMWSSTSKSAEMNCSHKRDAGHSQMYWYRQRPGEAMSLIVFTAVGVEPDYVGDTQQKYSAVKTVVESGALTVKDLQPEDSAVYFCAVSKHSDVRLHKYLDPLTHTSPVYCLTPLCSETVKEGLHSVCSLHSTFHLCKHHDQTSHTLSSSTSLCDR
uniref:Ig-like domain-containing protein n=1 Tax=Myripristis murdjan TaxID=586833 RepID=A0A667YGP7_9TELE